MRNGSGFIVERPDFFMINAAHLPSGQRDANARRVNGLNELAR